VDQDACAEPADRRPRQQKRAWVSVVASDAGAPYTVFDKVRRGDREVEISVKTPHNLEGRTPVLVDDIISSGRTMIEAVRLIRARGASAPVCVTVHGLFADNSDALLKQTGARVVTSNSISHPTNGIDVAELLATSVRELTPMPARNSILNNSGCHHHDD
jgi:ribose-phosphate pyrophosphokinase